MSQNPWEEDVSKNEEMVTSIKYCWEVKQVEDRKFSIGFNMGGHW